MYSEKKKYADLIVDFPSTAQETYTYSLEGNLHVKVGQVVEIPEVKEPPKKEIDLWESVVDKPAPKKEEVGVFKKMVNKWKEFADN